MPAPARRPTRWLAWLPLKWRVALGSLAIVMLGIAGTSVLELHLAERGVLTAAQQRETAEARRTAEIIDRRVSEMLRALQLVGDRLDPAMLTDPPALALFLQSKPVAQSMFANIYVAAPSGQLLLFSDASGIRHPAQSIGDRPYFQQVLRERQPVVSQPVLGRMSSEPVLIFSHPVMRGDQVIAVIGGALRLASRDLLADLAQAAHAGEALMMVTDRQGTVLAHPQRAALMKPLMSLEPFAGGAAPKDLAAAGAVPWAEAARGEMLIASAPVPGTGWQVWRVHAHDDLLAPLHQARRETLVLALLCALVLGGLLVGFLHSQFAPLRRLASQLQARARGAGPLELSLHEERGEIGRLVRALEAAMRDQASAEQARLAAQRRLEQVMAASPVGLLFTRAQHLELVNEEAAHLLGHDAQNLLGQPLQTIHASGEAHRDIARRCAAILADGAAFVEDVQLRHASGTLFWARLHARRLDRGDAEAGIIWSFHDIHGDVMQRRKLEFAANHDPLTGLANRERFLRHLESAFESARAGQKAAVLMLDLDHFKPLNDTHGHAAGDAMLKAVAQEFLKVVRGSDTVARLGGDEFAVVLMDCDSDNAQAIAEKLRQCLHHPLLAWQGQRLQVGVSVGVAPCSARHSDPAAWLAEADAALYESKRLGREPLRAMPTAAPAERPNLTLVGRGEGGSPRAQES